MTLLLQFPTPSIITVNDIQLEVYEFGKQHHGNPIVLCHGWPELAYSWRFQIEILVDAGYHVIVPNQRGFGQSSKPADIEHYNITYLTQDLVSLLDHFHYDHATFVGHDWGAMVVWSLAQMHADKVNRIINLSLPYQDRGDIPWLAMMEQLLGPNYYFVHFNQHIGVADGILEQHTERFMTNFFRTDKPVELTSDKMEMIELALAEQPKGHPLMSDKELAVYIDSFNASGFTSNINWYRNLDNNWHRLSQFDAVIKQPTLMVYGSNDVIPQLPEITDYVPDITIKTIAAGHHIQQERPSELNQVIIDWLASH